jgi:hypothetical protein
MQIVFRSVQIYINLAVQWSSSRQLEIQDWTPQWMLHQITRLPMVKKFMEPSGYYDAPIDKVLHFIRSVGLIKG